MNYATEIHQRLESNFGIDKAKQYQWLYKHFKKNHVSDLNHYEMKKCLKYLRKSRITPEFVWKLLEGI
jgi:hypothetical protein